MNQFRLKNKWNYENGFYLTSDSSRIGKTLSQFEIFKEILNVKGDIFEFGVFKGASLMRLASFRKLLKLEKKRIYGFDSFGKFPKQNNMDDNNFIQKFEKDSGIGISKSDLKNFLNSNKYKNIELLKGDILKTLPIFLKSKKNLKISFIHIDVDVYEPTKVILENLFKHLSVGGIVMLDDYSIIDGETKAVDEFLSQFKQKYKIFKSKYSKTPFYFKKK